MFKPSVILLALLLSGSTLWSAFIESSMSITTALTRFLIAVPVAAVMVYIWQLVTTTRHRPGSGTRAGTLADGDS